MMNDIETSTHCEIVAGDPSLNRQTEFGLADLSIDDHLQDELEMTTIFGNENLPDAPIEASEDLLSNIGSIPSKMAFKIGEAAEMVGVKQYVLRYWESEFEMLRPRKSTNGQRIYSRRDVECAMMIKKLLYNDRFSIEGARAALRQLKSSVKEEKSAQVIARTQETSVASAILQMRRVVEDIRKFRQSL